MTATNARPKGGGSRADPPHRRDRSTDGAEAGSSNRRAQEAAATLIGPEGKSRAGAEQFGLAWPVVEEQHSHAAAAAAVEIVREGRAGTLLKSSLHADPEAGNVLAKQLSLLANADAARIVLGARVAIIRTAAADTVRARVASCAVAALLAHARRPAAAALAAE